MDRVEPLGGKVRQRSSHRPPLAPKHAGRHDPADARGVEIQALLQGRIEDDGHARPALTLRDAEKRQSVPGHDVRGVDDSHATCSKTRLSHGVQLAEHLGGPSLIPRVTEHRLPERIGGEHLIWREVASRERGLAGSGGAGKDDEGVRGDLDRW